MRNFNIKKVGIYLKSKINTQNIAYLLISLVILGLGTFMYQNHEKIEQAKAELLKTSLEDKKLIDYKNKIKDRQKKIKIRNESIRQMQIDNLKDIDFEECFKEQVGRMINQQESLVDYCEDKFNQVPEVHKKGEILGKEEPIAQKTRKVVRNDWDISDVRQDYISYVLEKAGKDALLTFTGENTFWTLDRPSNKLGTGGYRAYGFCQLYYQYHKQFIDSEDFKDPYKQLDYCIGVYKDGEKRGILNTTFYAYPGRSKWNYLYKFL